MTLHSVMSLSARQVAAQTDLFDDDIRGLLDRVGRVKQRNGLCFYGSSSFRLWDRIVEDFADLRIVNCGFGGGTNLSARLYLADVVTQLWPASMVLYFGENDIAVDGLTAQRAYDHLQELISDIRKLLPASGIFVMSAKVSPARIPYGEVIRAYNDRVEQLCAARPELTFVDGASCLRGENGLPLGRCFVGDGIHLSPFGYYRWHQVLKAVPGLF